LGQNVDIYIGNDVNGEHPGTLCAYGPTSDRQSEYVIHCFNGAMSGQLVTIRNRFTGSLKLCDVQVLGEYGLFPGFLLLTSFYWPPCGLGSAISPLCVCVWSITLK